MPTSEQMDALLNLGVGGALVVIILVLVFGFISKQRNNKTDSEPTSNGVPHTTGHLSAIHEVVMQRDDDGTPRVYVPRSLAIAIHELAEATRGQTQMLERLNSNVTEARRDIDELKLTTKLN